MNQFNVGDRIIVHNTKGLKYPKYFAGKQGVVVETNFNDVVDFVVVKFDGNDYQTIIRKENIKKEVK